MNLIKTPSFTLFSLIFLYSCTNLDDTTNNDIVIYQDQNTTITLLDVEDSRCPTDVLCVWQGNAVVDMRVEKNNETSNFTLNTAGNSNSSSNYPDTISILDLNIELIDLLPHPETDTSYFLEEYTVDLEVTYE